MTHSALTCTRMENYNNSKIKNHKNKKIEKPCMTCKHFMECDSDKKVYTS